MFVYSVRASTLKFFAFVLLAVALLAGAVILGPADSVYAAADNTTVSYEGIKTNEDRVGFIEKLGISVKDTPTDEQSFTVPDSFDRVISGYNELQKRQGLSLDKYAGKKVTRYTYEVENYKGHEGTVYANLFIYKSRIVACDICGASPNSFVAPLTLVDQSMLDKGEK